MDVELELKKIIYNIANQEERDLKIDDDLEQVLGYTSIEYIQLIVDIEEFFSIEFDFEDIDLEAYRTYGSLLEYIKTKLV